MPLRITSAEKRALSIVLLLVALGLLGLAIL